MRRFVLLDLEDSWRGRLETCSRFNRPAPAKRRYGKFRLVAAVCCPAERLSKSAKVRCAVDEAQKPDRWRTPFCANSLEGRAARPRPATTNKSCKSNPFFTLNTNKCKHFRPAKNEPISLSPACSFCYDRLRAADPTKPLQRSGHPLDGLRIEVAVSESPRGPVCP